MKLSIILVNYRGWKRLRLCLESLRCLKDAPFTWEVIVIDNQSADNQLPKFISDFPEFGFLGNTDNNGFSNGCNLGASKAKGEYLFFLNPDTIVSLDAIQQLLQTAVAHPEISILSCQQLDDKGNDTLPYGLALRLETLTGFLRFLYRLIHKKSQAILLSPSVPVIFPEWVSGSAVWMNQKKFNELGGWCEDFWMYYEDADLCKRAWESNGRVALLTNVSIIHNHGGSSRVNLDTKILTKSETLISKHVYLSKHFHGKKELMMHSYLILNCLIGQPLLVIIASIFFFIPSLRVYPKLFLAVVKYYFGAYINKSWLSPRSTNYGAGKA